MRNLLLILLLVPIISFGQEQSPFAKSLKKTFKFATFYGAVNGGNSISDRRAALAHGTGTGAVGHHQRAQEISA